MNTADAEIPYERQSDPQTNRTCGAACLSMVYRSFGREVAQAQIWPAIAKPNQSGRLASTTHLMARDALSRGLGAVAIQARRPLQALHVCRQGGLRAILNHRLRPDTPTGHYTVLVDIDDTRVAVHDPLLGPARVLSHAELLELWQPRPGSEIAGYVLIAIAATPPVAGPCPRCRTPIPSSVECPRCQKPVTLHPAAPLGCMSAACVARMWNYLCCPSCDYTWSFSLEAPPVGATASERPGAGPAGPPTPAESDADPWKLARLFAELDKFRALVLGTPAANHPDVKQQMDFIAASREALKLAQAEELAHRKVRREQLSALEGLAKQNEAAHRQRMEDLNRPSPPLDGDALARALLKNLGLSD